MRKHNLLLGLVMTVIMAGFSVAYAGSDEDLKTAIKYYKAGNYAGCIQLLEPVIKEDPSNAVAHYYMAIANAQAGRLDEAMYYYDSVISLNSHEVLVRYSKKGKRCIEDADACTAVENLDEFIRARKGFDITNKVKNSIETQSLDELRRDINDNKEIEPARFKKFKNFSSNADEAPSNDEIVAALRTLQRAGIAPQTINPVYTDLGSVFASTSYGNRNATSMDNLMNLMSRIDGVGSSGMNKIDPRVMQSMITSQMMGF